MLKRSHTGQSENAIMCINNPVSFEFFVTNDKKTREIFFITNFSNANLKQYVLSGGNFWPSWKFRLQNTVFSFRDFAGAKGYHYNLVRGGRYSNSLSQSQEGERSRENQ